MSILATGIYYRLKGEPVFRGPFAEEEVLEWYRSGWFTSTTAFRFGDDESVVTLGDLCDKNGAACPFRGGSEQQEAERATAAVSDHSHHAHHEHDSHRALRHMQEQINVTNRLLQASVERCTKLEQIVSSVVERFLLFSGELSDVKAEWNSVRNTSCITGASSSVTSSTTTLASAASSSSSLNLLLQLKDDMNALENALRGSTDHLSTTEDALLRECAKSEHHRGEAIGGEERRTGAAGDPASSCCGVHRTDSGLSTVSSIAKRTTSSEEDDGDETMMELSVDERAAASEPETPSRNNNANAHRKLRPLPYLTCSTPSGGDAFRTPSKSTVGAPMISTPRTTTVEYTALARRIGFLESGLREAVDRIEEMKAADLSHVLESIDRVSDELSASQAEMKTQRSLDRGAQLVMEDAVQSLKRDRKSDQERLVDVERFMGKIMGGLPATDELINVRAIRDELQAGKERDEFIELRLYGMDDKLRNHTDGLELTAERLAALEETATKMLTRDSFKAMLTSHAEELNSKIRMNNEQTEYRINTVEAATSRLSVDVEELKEAVEDLLDETQAYDEDEDEDGYDDNEEEEEGYCAADDECTCSMCREGRTPKVISDLLNGHRGYFDNARIATRADLIDIRDALSVRRRRSSFIDDTRHFFGEGVHCDHCDVTIHEGVSLLSHVSSERHAQATCILKEDLRFWWNRIREADE